MSKFSKTKEERKKVRKNLLIFYFICLIELLYYINFKVHSSIKLKSRLVSEFNEWMNEWIILLCNINFRI